MQTKRYPAALPSWKSAPSTRDSRHPRAPWPAVDQATVVSTTRIGCGGLQRERYPLIRGPEGSQAWRDSCGAEESCPVLSPHRTSPQTRLTQQLRTGCAGISRGEGKTVSQSNILVLQDFFFLQRAASEKCLDLGSDVEIRARSSDVAGTTALNGAGGPVGEPPTNASRLNEVGVIFTRCAHQPAAAA